MGKTRVQHLTQEISRLTEAERQELAEAVLPSLLLTREGLQAIDRALQTLPTEELDALVERLRNKNQDLSDSAIATVIREALQATRAASRS